jgi:hypothetical protein
MERWHRALTKCCRTTGCDLEAGSVVMVKNGHEARDVLFVIVDFVKIRVNKPSK